MNLIEQVNEHVSEDLISKAAQLLLESKESTQRAFALAVPIILGNLVKVGKDPKTMNFLWDMILHRDVKTAVLAMPSDVLNEVNQSIPEVSIHERFTTELFAGQKTELADSLVTFSGLQQIQSGSKIFSLITPIVMAFLKKKVQNENFGVSGLSMWLGGFKKEIIEALPVSMIPQFGFSSEVRLEKAPSVYAYDEYQDGQNWWLWLLGLLAAIGLLWTIMKTCQQPKMVHKIEQTIQDASAAVDSAALKAADVANSAANSATQAMSSLDSTIKTKWLALGKLVKNTLPGGKEIQIPENGIEKALITFIQDAKKMVDKSTWFNFDRILFESGSASLNPVSMDQIKNIAQILIAYPNVHIKIGGYTDNAGDAIQNKNLSSARAKSVLAALTSFGVDPSRMTSEGYGQEQPVASNETEEGRELNRRVSIRVTKK
ncbi:MAG: OmpA family protein [Bacteroidota bacterium]|nr:OmpA family protein [Bacteroidota bacterium]